MAKNIIATVQPFDFGQKIYLFEDGVVKQEIRVTMPDLAETLVSASYQNELAKVTLHGPAQFTQKVKEDIEGKELAMYRSRVIEVELAE